jgi:hypothetical protein
MEELVIRNTFMNAKACPNMKFFKDDPKMKL